MANNSAKQRLFEVMSKVDNSFKPKLNEEVTSNLLNFNKILSSYLETALWAESGDNDMELNHKTIHDFSKTAIQASKNDINKFIELAQQQAPEELSAYSSEMLGHKIWLSRNGHGSGFFDENNDKLQEIARSLKPAEIYVGEDKQIYIMGNESGLNEMSNWGKTRANPKYSHFAVLKGVDPAVDGKIVNGWEYGGYDPAELRQFKKDYFYQDIKDNQINPKIINIVTAKHLQKQGINPYDFNNWYKNEKDGFIDQIFTM